MIKERITNNIKEKNMKQDFGKNIERLIENIKVDYAKWMTSPEMVERFNEGVKVSFGRKYTKIMNGSSVWGFIANGDGVLKGIPYKKGDVFKAASWRGPAKHQRGSIFDKGTNWFAWTGPRYL